MPYKDNNSKNLLLSFWALDIKINEDIKLENQKKNYIYELIKYNSC